MSTWKLPRKRKKAFIARYGRAAYKALRYLDRTRRDGVLSLRHDHGMRIDIAVDFGVGRPVAVLSRRVNGGVHVLAQVNLSTRTAKKRKTMADYRVGQFEDGSPLYMMPSHWIRIAGSVVAPISTNPPGFAGARPLR